MVWVRWGGGGCEGPVKVNGMEVSLINQGSGPRWTDVHTRQVGGIGVDSHGQNCLVMLMVGSLV